MSFVTVYQKSDGKKVRVPQRWLANPRLAANFTKTPAKKGGQKAATKSAATKSNAPAAGDAEKE